MRELSQLEHEMWTGELSHMSTRLRCQGSPHQSFEEQFLLNPSYPHCFAMSGDLMEVEGGGSISNKSGAHILPTSDEKLVNI